MEHDPNVQSVEFIESLYDEFLRDPESVQPHWRRYFRDLPGDGLAPAALEPVVAPQAVSDGQVEAPRPAPAEIAAIQHCVDHLIRNYRVRGHMIAQIDPLGRPRPAPPELEPVRCGILDEHMDLPFTTDSIGGVTTFTLREIIQRLRNTYCRSIGTQFMHIDDLKVREWLQQRMESSENRVELSRAEQLRILEHLTDAVIFEEFIQKKFLGAKSFSLEGAETLIPLLATAIEQAAEHGVDEIVMGMAHRGRLNVLANVVGKGFRQIFREFEDADAEQFIGRGDVKYHLGHSGDWTTASGKQVHLSLCFNPSHLEFVNPVALGRTRAKQDRAALRDQEHGRGPQSHFKATGVSLSARANAMEHGVPARASDRVHNDRPAVPDSYNASHGLEAHAPGHGLEAHAPSPRQRKMCLLIHGDAAFIGEGVVQETLNLSELDGYATGGTLHVVVNNQIGFTTAPEEGRSSVYATDIAKMLQIPIFHVNGEDPEAVAQVVRLAMDFRAEFRRDVVIDMYCYRRHGHNEGDEPSFTQPVMYRAIQQRQSVREGYLEHLLALEGVTREEADRIADRRRELLERELEEAKDLTYEAQASRGIWEGYLGGDERQIEDMDTGVEQDRLSAILERLTVLPDEFSPNPKIKRGLEQRRQMARGTRPLDWSAAEALAFGTLVTEGVRIRLTGQDSVRGTFSQRHAVLFDHENGAGFMPLRNIADGQASIEFFNSPLSESGVLGFDYGYSLDCPDGLVLWEAQFGDFGNAAQVIIDQFLVSAEDKWRRLSGLVLLLPHGFEGQGPEHSSARLERFLTVAADWNIQIAYPTTPAQYFHLLRRQVLRRWRKPLIVMTPKSLLRHPKCISSLEECSAGRFLRVIGDAKFVAQPDAKAVKSAKKKSKKSRSTSSSAHSKVKRILLCTGKIYYELLERREELEREDIAILRVEQLYPLPQEPLRAAVEPFTKAKEAIWVQEEPENMGAWRFMRIRLGERLFDRLPLSVISRPASASPATGSKASHTHEQQRILEQAFGAE